jgi:hypothetical protein
VPKLPFTDEELAILDGPTASPFVSFVRCVFAILTFVQTMESVGGTLDLRNAS